MLSEVFIAGDHLPSDGTGFFETGCFSSWGTQDNPFTLSPDEHRPVLSFSGSDNSTPKTNSSDEVNVMDERRQRRMISNRESARRSRVRKQKHVENLKNQLNRFKTGNKDLTNQLRVLNLHGNLIQQENQKLQLESLILEQKLRGIRQMLEWQLQHQLLLPTACMNLQ